MPDTTPLPDGGDTNASQDNWEQRYAGLQKVLAKRDTELTSATALADSLKAEHEQAIADLATYRQRDVDTSEEETARATFEQLRERFDPAPKPIGNNPVREWTDPGTDHQTPWRDRERQSEGAASGWPT